MERAIGWIKTFTVLKHTPPISFGRISNQIVCICAYLSNFMPVLLGEVTSLADDESTEVDDYFEELSDTDNSEDY